MTSKNDTVDLSSSDIASRLTNQRILNNDKFNKELESLFEKTTTNLSMLDKKTGLEKFRRAEQLNRVGLIESNAPYLINGGSKYISTRLRNNNVRKYDLDFNTLNNVNRFSNLSKNIKNKIPKDYAEKKYSGESNILRKQFDKEIGQLSKQIDNRLTTIRDNDNPPQKIQYNTVYDYFFDNKALDNKQKNKNPIYTNLTNNLVNSINNNNNDFNDAYRITNDIIKQAKHDKNSSIINRLQQIEGNSSRDYSQSNEQINYQFRQFDANNLLKNELERQEESQKYLQSSQRNILDIKNNTNELINVVDELSNDTKKAKIANEEIQQRIINALPSLLNGRDEEIKDTNKNLNSIIELLANSNDNKNILKILTEISNRIDKLQNTNEKLNRSNITNDNVDLKNQIEKNEQSIKKLEDVSYHLKKKNIVLEFQNNATTKESEKLYEEINSLKNTIKKRNEGKEIYEAALDSLKRNFQKINGSNNNDSQLLKIQKDIVDYQKKIDEYGSEVKQLNQKLLDIEYQNIKLNNTLNNRNDDFKKQLNNLSTKNGILENDLLENKNTINKLDETLNDFNLFINHNGIINQELGSIKNDRNQENDENDHDTLYNNNNNNYPPSPPAPGAGAITITENNGNEQISTERLIDDITSSIHEQVENQYDIANQYENNVDNTANYLLSNSNTIDPNNPLSETRQQEFFKFCENITDPDWRDFYVTCLGDTVFLKILRDNNIEFTENGYIIREGVLHSNINLIQFIDQMSNPNSRTIPLCVNFNGNFASFLDYILINFNDTDNFSYATYFKYIVSLYNSCRGKKLQFKHESELNDHMTVKLFFKHPTELVEIICTLLNKHSLTSLPKLMKTILENFIRYMIKYGKEINITLDRILHFIKNLSDTTKQEDFIIHFQQYSNIWKSLVGKKGSNSFAILRALKLDDFINIMTEIIIEAGRCPPNRNILKINIGSELINIMQMYNFTINSNNKYVLILRRVLIILYFYLGITVNIDNNTNQSVVNEYVNSFMQMISEDSLTRDINNNENINFIGLSTLLSNLEEKYQEYSDRDSLASQIQYNAKKINNKKFKKKSNKIRKPYYIKRKKAKQNNESFTKELNNVMSNIVKLNDEEKMDEEDIPFLDNDQKNDDYALEWDDELFPKQENVATDLNDMDGVKEIMSKYSDLLQNDIIPNESSKPIFIDELDQPMEEIKEDQVGDVIYEPQSCKDLAKNISKDIKIENIHHTDDDDNETVNYNHEDNEMMDYDYNDDTATVDYNFNHDVTELTNVKPDFYKITQIKTNNKGPVPITNADSNAMSKTFVIPKNEKEKIQYNIQPSIVKKEDPTPPDKVELVEEDLILDEQRPKNEDISGNNENSLYSEILSYKSTGASTDFARSERIDDNLQNMLDNNYSTLTDISINPKIIDQDPTSELKSEIYNNLKQENMINTNASTRKKSSKRHLEYIKDKPIKKLKFVIRDGKDIKKEKIIIEDKKTVLGKIKRQEKSINKSPLKKGILHKALQLIKLLETSASKNINNTDADIPPAKISNILSRLNQVIPITLSITATKRLLTIINIINSVLKKVDSNIIICIDSFIHYIQTGNIKSVENLNNSSTQLSNLIYSTLYFFITNYSLKGLPTHKNLGAINTILLALLYQDFLKS